MILNPYKTRKIQFYDWDDTIIGELIVPQTWKGKQLQYYVNMFVGFNMIHPDLRSADPRSLTRASTYRGKYPTTPQPLDPNVVEVHRNISLSLTDTNTPKFFLWFVDEVGSDYRVVDDGTVRADGPDYPLTNKLDYAYLRRHMVKDTSDPTKNKWVQQDVNELANCAPLPTDEYAEERVKLREEAKKSWPHRHVHIVESWTYEIDENEDTQLKHKIHYAPDKYLSSHHGVHAGFRPKKEVVENV